MRTPDSPPCAAFVATLALLIVVGCTPVEAPRPPFRALGTEPFWALQIDSVGLRFMTPEDQVGALFAPVAMTHSGDTLHWAGAQEGGTIDARIWPGQCSDGMSDRVWTHTARVQVSGTTYHGCATILVPGGSPGPSP
ncbi:MAG: hypothetical protein ABJB33_05035 [Gemmatimonadota bacterium]